VSKKERRETARLEDKLWAAYHAWKPAQSETNPPYDIEALARLIMAREFTDDPEKRQKIQEKIEALKPREDVINISVSPTELMRIVSSLIVKQQILHAEQYVKDSLGTGISSEQRLSKVAEIIGIKEPGKKLKTHNDDVFCFYWAHIKRGLKPRQASEEVFKKFKFISQEACDQWLKRKVNEMKKKHSDYAYIPAPSTSPRLK
jgi:hypothetical protein